MPPDGVTFDYLLSGIMKSPTVAAGVAAGWALLFTMLVVAHRFLRRFMALEIAAWVIVTVGIVRSSLYWAGVLNGHAWDSTLPDMHSSPINVVLGTGLLAILQVVIWPLGWAAARFLFITRPESQAALDAEMAQDVLIGLVISVAIVLVLRRFNFCLAKTKQLLQQK